MFALHEQLGVVSAAVGLAVGSALMVLIQVPTFLRLTSLRGLRLAFERRLLIAAVAFVPIASYSFGRQMQVFVERFVGSTLQPGAISQMNYASKVSQMASLLALTAAAVAFPSLARMASDRQALKRRIEQEVRRLLLLITPAIAFLCLFAGPCIRVLFERGAFGPSDTAETTVVMRVYCLGLLGQVLVSLGAFVCFGTRRRSWIPGVAIGVGLLVTVVLDVSLAPSIGVVALAVGNAVGIVVAALLLWAGVRRRIVDFDAHGLARLLALAAPLAAASATVAWLLCRLLPQSPLAEVLVGGTLTVVLFLSATAVLHVSESRALMRTISRAARRVVRRAEGGTR
jgi:putative peptidoglycan lipid II flippase